MSDILIKFGLKVKKIRLKKGLSQEKLAELADLHRTYINEIESGKRNIAMKNAEKIAEALHVKLTSLLNGG